MCHWHASVDLFVWIVRDTYKACGDEVWTPTSSAYFDQGNALRKRRTICPRRGLSDRIHVVVATAFCCIPFAKSIHVVKPTLHSLSVDAGTSTCTVGGAMR